MRGDHTQWPPMTRFTIPSCAKRFMPRDLRSPMPSEWITVSPRGWLVSRKRFSIASCRHAASHSPPPPPISATVSPSAISATAASAVTNLSIAMPLLTQMTSAKRAAPCFSIDLAMTVRWISDVPSKMRKMRASR
jgi:hypothetical protein